MSSTFTVATTAVAAVAKATDHLRSLCLAGMVRESRCHLMKIMASAELYDGVRNAGSLKDSDHNRAFMVLHQKNLPEASFLCLMAGDS